MKRFLWISLLWVGGPFMAAGGEWIDLFDGKSTAGWTPRSEVVSFEAKDGELRLLTTTNCWVTTAVQMADFEVEAEVMLPEDAAEVGFNSGLAFRCTGADGKPTGYQCEIDLGKPGGVYGIGLGGWFVEGKGQKHFKPGEWNHFRVVAEGPRLRTYVNGKLVSDFEDDQSLRGYFAIQHHGKGGPVRFRKIRARKPAPTAAAAAVTRTTAAAAAPVAPRGKMTGAPGPPNLLWITAEDMSATLGCYGDEYATTPHIDQLAKESVRYTHAFAAAPVCSPSRSCLITGMYPVTTGTQQMRSAFPLPAGVRGFPAYLREAGYFCTNNVKTDYNNGDADRLVAESWNESSDTAHWRHTGRKAGQPFFSVFNDMTSHQSRTMVWPYAAFQKHVQSLLSPEEIHDPAKAPLPPYYPDTPEIRKTVARFYDCVTAMDKNVGRILAELEEDGLAGDTIVFFYSDHGSGMPRHKRLLHDSGMHVPLMIRFPGKYRHLAPSPPGTTTDRLVSFVDFPATVLSVAGLETPDYLQGTPFLGKDAGAPREYVYGSRDRVDEVFEMARSVRDKRWLYLRNYHPHLTHNQPSVFSDLGTIRQAINAFPLKKMTDAQHDYAGPTKPAEALYDCVNDPQNVINLLDFARDAEQNAALRRLRREFQKRRVALNDAGFIPEGEAWNAVRDEGASMKEVLAGETNHRPGLAAAMLAADLVGKGGRRIKDMLSLLESNDPAQRFWAVIALRSAATTDQAVMNRVAEHLLDLSADVRIEAAGWLANDDAARRNDALEVLVDELDNEDWWTALRACRAIELLGKKALPVKDVMRALYDATRHEAGDANLYLAFSAGAWLEKMGEPTEPWDFTPGAGSFMPPKKGEDEDEDEGEDEPEKKKE